MDRPAATLFVPGDFINVRNKSWILEGKEQLGPILTLKLVSLEDDSQGETLQVALLPELQAEVIDPNDWSPLLARAVQDVVRGP